MPSLPAVGASDDTWGAELNAFLTVAIDPAAGTLQPAIAGNGLSIAAGVLAVGVDGSTVEISADALRVKDAGITSAKLAAGVAAANLGYTPVNKAGDTLTGAFNLTDGATITGGTSTGTKIGTATSQKLGFFNSAPVIQPAATTDLRQALIDLGLYATGGASPLNLNGGTLTAAIAALGTTPAAAGVIRIPNAGWLAGRNAANSADVNMLRLNASDQIEIGAPASTTGPLTMTRSSAAASPGQSLFATTTLTDGANPSVLNIVESAVQFRTSTPSVGPVAVQALVGTITYGLGGGTAANGNAHAVSAQAVGARNANAANELAAIFAAARDDTPAGEAHLAMWAADINVHGAVGEQQNKIHGVVSFVGNYYNGSPVTTDSFGMAIATRQGGGGGSDGAHTSATSYPADVGLLITGASGTADAGIGFTTAIRVGGSRSPWFNTGTPKIGTGISLDNWETYGLRVAGRTAAATGPAISVAASAGYAVIGADARVSTSALLEVVGPASAVDPLVQFGQASTAQAYSINLRNSAAQFKWFVAGSAGQFVTSSAAGDGGIAIIGAKKFLIGPAAGTVVAAFEAAKIGFFSATTAAQQTVTGSRGGNAALASLLTALAAYGIVVDSSTA